MTENYEEGQNIEVRQEYSETWCKAIIVGKMGGTVGPDNIPLWEVEIICEGSKEGEKNFFRVTVLQTCMRACGEPESQPLQPGDRILLEGEKFPDDEIEVIRPVGLLAGGLHDELLLRYVKRPVVFRLMSGMKYRRIEGLP